MVALFKWTGDIMKPSILIYQYLYMTQGPNEKLACDTLDMTMEDEAFNPLCREVLDSIRFYLELN